MAAPVILYLDTTRKQLVANFLTSISPISSLLLEAGDLVPLQLHFLQANTSNNTPGALPYSYIDPSAVTPVTLALGLIQVPPTGGTFTVTFGANTTSALAFNLSAAALSTALNALASVVSAGGVTVSGNAGGPFTITFTSTGAQSNSFAVGAALLQPLSIGVTNKEVTGATGVSEVQVITLIQSPAALNSTWTNTYGTVAVTRIQAGGTGLNEIQRIAIPQGCYGGSFSINFGAGNTSSIAYNASGATVQAALQAVSTIGAGNCTVIQSSTTTWDVTFTGSLAGAGQTLMTANSAALLAPMYLAGNLNLNVQQLFNLLAGQASTSLTMQIQQGTSGNVNTVVQQPVTVNNTLIFGTPATPIPADPWQTLSQVNALIAAAAYVLPTSTTSVLGGVKIDGITIQINAGVISTVESTARVVTTVAVTSNATLANVTGLSVTVAAAGKYAFDCWLATTAAAAGGVQAAIGGTATATSIEYEGILVQASAISTQTRATALATAVCSSAAATAGTIRITGQIVVNAGGTLTVQFAQNTSNASASSVLAGSWFRVWPTAN